MKYPPPRTFLQAAADSSLESHTPWLPFRFHLQGVFPTPSVCMIWKWVAIIRCVFWLSSGFASYVFEKILIRSYLFSFEMQEQTCMPKTSIANLQLVHVEESIQTYLTVHCCCRLILRPIRKHLQWLQDHESSSASILICLSLLNRMPHNGQDFQ